MTVAASKWQHQQDQVLASGAIPMEKEVGEVWAEMRANQHSCWAVSYPRRADRIISVQPSEEDMAYELLDLCRANSTLSIQGSKELCRAKKREIKKGAKQQQEDQCPTGRSSGVVIAGAGASLVAPLAVSDGGGALASPPLPPPAWWRQLVWRMICAIRRCSRAQRAQC